LHWPKHGNKYVSIDSNNCKLNSEGDGRKSTILVQKISLKSEGDFKYKKKQVVIRSIFRPKKHSFKNWLRPYSFRSSMEV
jgi:hypothetical protein